MYTNAQIFMQKLHTYNHMCKVTARKRERERKAGEGRREYNA